MSTPQQAGSLHRVTPHLGIRTQTWAQEALSTGQYPDANFTQKADPLSQLELAPVKMLIPTASTVVTAESLRSRGYSPAVAADSYIHSLKD